MLWKSADRQNFYYDMPQRKAWCSESSQEHLMWSAMWSAFWEVKLELSQRGMEEVKEAQRRGRNIPGRRNCICKGPVVGRSMAVCERLKDSWRHLLFLCVTLCYYIENDSKLIILTWNKLKKITLVWHDGTYLVEKNGYVLAMCLHNELSLHSYLG